MKWFERKEAGQGACQSWLVACCCNGYLKITKSIETDLIDFETDPIDFDLGIAQTDTCPKCGGAMEVKEVGFFKMHEAVLLYIIGISFIAFDLWINIFANSASHTSGAIRGAIWVIIFIGALLYKIKQNVLKKVWNCPACQNEKDVKDSL